MSPEAPEPGAVAAEHGRGAPRSRFGPTVLLGLAAGGAAAVAGNQDWVGFADGSGADRIDGAYASSLTLTMESTAPPVTALALVCLAVWGVLLVTRGVVRRMLAWLGLLAGGALLVAAALAWQRTPESIAQDVRGLAIDPTRTWWAHLGVLVSVVALYAAVAAVRGVRRWPEMGRRYDAPSSARPGAATAIDDVGTASHLDLWRALDEGRDPTDPDGSGR